MVVLARDRDLLEAELALVEQDPVGIDRIDHHELRAVESDVALQQRQDAAANGAEADHHDRAGELRMQRGVVSHAGPSIHISYSEARGGQAARAVSLWAERAMSVVSAGFGSMR